MTSDSIYDMAQYILQHTHDGDDLSPNDLYLVQETVNGNVTEQGETAFYQLHKRVRDGYKKPWFHGIEHLTIDHEGYVYWKGKQVEHYSFYGDDACKREGEAAVELASRCKFLESKGIVVSCTTAIWRWEEYSKL